MNIARYVKKIKEDEPVIKKKEKKHANKKL